MTVKLLTDVTGETEPGSVYRAWTVQVFDDATGNPIGPPMTHTVYMSSPEAKDLQAAFDALAQRALDQARGIARALATTVKLKKDFIGA